MWRKGKSKGLAPKKVECTRIRGIGASGAQGESASLEHRRFLTGKAFFPRLIVEYAHAHYNVCNSRWSNFRIKCKDT